MEWIIQANAEYHFWHFFVFSNTKKTSRCSEILTKPEDYNVRLVVSETDLLICVDTDLFSYCFWQNGLLYVTSHLRTFTELLYKGGKLSFFSAEFLEYLISQEGRGMGRRMGGMGWMGGYVSEWLRDIDRTIKEI